MAMINSFRAKPVLLLCATLLLFAANPGHARWYQVNLVIFKQPGYIKQHETFPARDAINMDLPANAIHLRPNAAGQPRNFRIHPITDSEFNSALSRLKSSRLYPIIYKRSWVQKGLPKSRAQAVIIQAGDARQGQQTLTGTIQLHVSKYLHLKTDLKIIRDIAPQLENLASGEDTQVDGSAASTSHSNAGLYSEWKTSRRMRRNELHYIDHPLVGMLVKIVPIK